MQENTESEKPEGSEVPEEAETSSEETPENSPHESSNNDSEFEEHEVEVLPPEKKKNSGCGFLIIFLFLLASVSGLYYTDKIPKTVVQLIEPLLNKLNPSLSKIPPLPPHEKYVSEVEEQSPPDAIEEEIHTPKKETTTEIASPLSKDQTEKHISGSQFVTSIKAIEPDNITNISGAYTEVNKAKMKQAKKQEEPEELKETSVKESVPTVIIPAEHNRDIEKPSEKFREEPVQTKEKERNKAVQAYLDFFEASLLKLGELIKTGFVKGKNLLEQLLNKDQAVPSSQANSKGNFFSISPADWQRD